MTCACRLLVYRSTALGCRGVSSSVGGGHELGHLRLGIVADAETERLLHYRFTCGFLAGMYEAGCRRPIPPLHINWNARSRFLNWFKRHSPDGIICNISSIRFWLEEEGVPVPKRVSLSNLDLGGGDHDWAGTTQNSAVIGSAAVDLVIGQIHRNERGLNPHPKCVLIRSTWKDGPSVRARRTALPGRA